MLILKDIFVIIVAIEALGIMLFEMFGSQTPAAAKAFAMPTDFIQRPEAKVALGNQGLYNGFLGVGIFFARYYLTGSASFATLLLFIGFIVVAAIYGGLTANKTIILGQGLPAAIAFVLLLLAH